MNPRHPDDVTQKEMCNVRKSILATTNTQQRNNRMVIFIYTRPPKRDNGIPLIATEYHSVSFSTIGPFNDISVGFSGTLNGNLNYHSIPLYGIKNSKYH